MLTSLSSPTSAPFWVTNATLVGLANWLTPSTLPIVAEIERDLAGVGPAGSGPLDVDRRARHAGHDRGQRGALQRAVAVEGQRAGRQEAVGMCMPGRRRRVGCDLDRPAVRCPGAQEGQGQIVRAAEAVIDLTARVKVGCDAGRAARCW